MFMKKVARIVISLGMVSTLVFSTGCFGKFALTKKIYEFNDSLGGDDMTGKVIKSLVMWAMWIIPVYGVGVWVDFVILNLIEFWTGSNPLAMQEGQVETQLVERNGIQYQITATRNQFEVVQLSGENKGMKQSLNYNTNEMAWYNTSNGLNNKIIQYNMDDEQLMSVTYYTSDNQPIVVDAKTLNSFAADVAAR